jgi:hypothetical protein
MDHFEMPLSDRSALFAKYGLTADDVITANYDIYIDVAPYPSEK